MTMAEEQKYELVVDIDRLTIGDLERLEKPENTTAFIDLLQKAVTNLSIRDLPLTAIKQIAEAIRHEISGIRNSKN
jgi:hypothetical protein